MPATTSLRTPCRRAARSRARPSSGSRTSSGRGWRGWRRFRRPRRRGGRRAPARRRRRAARRRPGASGRSRGGAPRRLDALGLEPLDEMRAEEAAAARDEVRIRCQSCGGRADGSQSTRPSQPSRFSAYHSIVCGTPSSHETCGFQPVAVELLVADAGDHLGDAFAGRRRRQSPALQRRRAAGRAAPRRGRPPPRLHLRRPRPALARRGHHTLFGDPLRRRGGPRAVARAAALPRRGRRARRALRR